MRQSSLKSNKTHTRESRRNGGLRAAYAWVASTVLIAGGVWPDEVPANAPSRRYPYRAMIDLCHRHLRERAHGAGYVPGVLIAPAFR